MSKFGIIGNVIEAGKRPKFRQGESTKKSIGGHVADAPFPKALHDYASSKGLKSQSALMIALGKKSHSVIGRWYMGEHVPSPEEFGNLILVLKSKKSELIALEDAKYEKLIDSYAQEIIKGRGVPAVAKERPSVAKHQLGFNYNHSQAARKFGVSRGRISQLRERFNLPPLLEEEDMKVLSMYFDETKAERDKIQRYHKEKKEIA